MFDYNLFISFATFVTIVVPEQCKNEIKTDYPCEFEPTIAGILQSDHIPFQLFIYQL